MERSRMHHRKSRFHRFVYRTALFCMLLSSSGVLFIMRTSSAANINFFLRIGDPQPTVETEASVSILAGGASPRLSYLAQPTAVEEGQVSPTLSPAEVTINLYDGDTVPTGGAVSRDKAQEGIPTIVSMRPLFKGNVGVAESLLFVEVHTLNGSVMTTTFNAGKDGSWEWQVPRDLLRGEHVIYVTAFDPTGELKLGANELRFVSGSGELPVLETDPETDTPRTDVVLPPSLVAERSVLFDIRIQITGEEPHVIQPGDDVLAEISLLNIGSPGYIIDATVHYQIIDDVTNKVYFEESETIGISTKASYLKIFGLKPTMPEGDYRLEASVSYADTEAFAADHFTVDGPAVIAASNETRINVSTALEVLVIIMALSLLIMYVEYHTVEALQGIIRQINEDDLRKHGLL